jgi:hypothetical protein
VLDLLPHTLAGEKKDCIIEPSLSLSRESRAKVSSKFDTQASRYYRVNHFNRKFKTIKIVAHTLTIIDCIEQVCAHVRRLLLATKEIRHHPSIIQSNAMRLWRPTRFLRLLLCIALLQVGACASTSPAAQQQCEVPAPLVTTVQQAALACEPEIDLASEAAVRKLSLGNEWHGEGRYKAAFDAYEAVLAEHASLLTDAYALWGMVALRLDRDNPDYSRDAAQTVAYVLDQRAGDAINSETAAEARLLWFAAKIMIEADADKDRVIVENRKLEGELEQRDEAIQRLRELTVGR